MPMEGRAQTCGYAVPIHESSRHARHIVGVVGHRGSSSGGADAVDNIKV